MMEELDGVRRSLRTVRLRHGLVAGRGGSGRQNHVQVKRYESMVFDLISGCFIDVHRCSSLVK